jgi:hypothetical protein
MCEDNWKIMSVLRLQLNECVCQSVDFHTWEFGILCEEYLAQRYVGSFDLQRNSIYSMVYLPKFKIAHVSSR